MSIDLDERIIKGKKPLTAFDEIDSKFIGTDCYFSDKASDYGDLSNCQIASLLRKDEETGVFSATKNNSYAVFNFCLPCEWVEEEQILPKIDFESAKKDPNFEQCEIYGNELLYDTKNHVFYTPDGKIHFCLTHVAQRYAREERENEVDVIAEKKYRPYRLREFLHKFKFGEAIYIRPKNSKTNAERMVIFSEYRTELYKDESDGAESVCLNGIEHHLKSVVCLGVREYDLTTLFDNYEYFDGKEWKVFGVKE